MDLTGEDDGAVRGGVRVDSSSSSDGAARGGVRFDASSSDDDGVEIARAVRRTRPATERGGGEARTRENKRTRTNDNNGERRSSSGERGGRKKVYRNPAHRAHAWDRERRRKEREARGAPKKIRFKPEEDAIILGHAASLGSDVERSRLSKWGELASVWKRVRPANGRDATAEQLRRRYQKLQSDRENSAPHQMPSSSAGPRSTCYLLELVCLRSQDGMSDGERRRVLDTVDGQTYFGETHFFRRRVKKHNGHLAGGARKTSELLRAALRTNRSSQWCPRVRVEGFPEAHMQHGKYRKSFEWKLRHVLDSRGKGVRSQNRKGSRVVYKSRRSKGIDDDVQQLARVLQVWKDLHPGHRLRVVWSRRIDGHGRAVRVADGRMLPAEFTFPEDACPYPQTFENFAVQ